MKKDLQLKLYEAAPLLYAMVMKLPEWKIEVPDDLFPFLLELHNRSKSSTGVTGNAASGS